MFFSIGTGKTYTGIKLVSLFNKINELQHKNGKQKKQVLFCGPSNRSVDLVAGKCLLYTMLVYVLVANSIFLKITADRLFVCIPENSI